MEEELTKEQRERHKAALVFEEERSYFSREREGWMDRLHDQEQEILLLRESAPRREEAGMQRKAEETVRL